MNRFTARILIKAKAQTPSQLQTVKTDQVVIDARMLIGCTADVEPNARPDGMRTEFDDDLPSDQLKGFARVGYYFSLYSEMEAALDGACLALFGLLKEPGAGVLVQNVDLIRKVEFLRNGLPRAGRSMKNPQEWRATADKTCGSILGRNDQRKRFAHDIITVDQDGSVCVGKRGHQALNGATVDRWDASRFDAEYRLIEKLIGELRSIIVDLMHYRLKAEPADLLLLGGAIEFGFGSDYADGGGSAEP